MDIKGIFSSDRAVLITCIIIAGVLWWMNKMSQEVKWERKIPVQYEISKEYVFSEKPRHSLRYTVEGSGWQLLALSWKDLDSLRLDVPGRPGNHNWNSEQIRQLIREKDIRDEIEITDIVPFRLSIRLEEAFVRCLNIKALSNITYVRGYATTNGIDLEPDTVCVRGPKTLVDQRSYWPTDTIQLKNINSSQNGLINLTNDHPDLIHLDPPMVKYNLDVIEYTELKKYAPIRLVNAPKEDSISLFPRRALVSMNVPIDKYDSAKEQEIGLFVDLQEKGGGPNSAQIRIPDNLPVWMKNIDVQPTQVEYYFVEKEEE